MWSAGRQRRRRCSAETTTQPTAETTTTTRDRRDIRVRRERGTEQGKEGEKTEERERATLTHALFESAVRRACVCPVDLSPGHQLEYDAFPQHAIDKFLPAIRGRPFTYGLTGNLSAGLTVALINIPLSLSLAVASATTPQAGMITAVWGALAAAITGGSQYNIMGPTGALSGILARFAILWGPGCLPVLSITSGIIMFLVFVFNLDRYCTFLPSSVAHGFTLGVAVIIAGNQIGAAFSLPPIQSSAEFLVNMVSYAEELGAGQADWRAFGVFFTAWIALFGLVKIWPRIPWMVPICLLGSGLGWMSTNAIWGMFRLKTLRDKYGDLELVLWAPPQLEQPAMMAEWGEVIGASMSIAFVGVLESLISGKIADGLTRTTMIQRQEVFAVSAANLAAGFTGGIPATAALARTALNIRSGGQSRLAGIFNALFTLLIGMFALPLFGYMPLCIVAALLFQVAVGMVETKHLHHAFHIDRGAFWLTILVGILCFVFDPTTAIVIGAVAGLLRFAESVATGYSEVTLTRDYQTGQQLDLESFDSLHLKQVDEGIIISSWKKLLAMCGSHDAEQESRLAVKASLQSARAAPVAFASTGPLTSASYQSLADQTLASPESFEQDTVIYRIVGDLTYISALHHCQRLRRLDSSKHLIISLRYCYYVDLDGMDALEETLSGLARTMPEGPLAPILSLGVDGAATEVPPSPAPRYILLAGIPAHGMVSSLLQKSAWFARDFLNPGYVFHTNGDAAKFLREKSQFSNPASSRSSPNRQLRHLDSFSSASLQVPTIPKPGPLARRMSLEGDIS